MIYVLNVISGLNNAGTEAVVMNYYRNIDRSKIQFDFLVLDTSENLYYEKEIKELGGRVFKIPPFSINPIENILKRKQFFKQHKYDIVEVHAPSALRSMYCKLAKRSGARVVFHIHNTSNVRGILVDLARKRIKKYCDEIVTCSQYAAISVLGEEANKVIYNAIDSEKYAFNEERGKQLRSMYGIEDNVRIVGTVGRFSNQKNQKFLIKAFAIAARKDERLTLFIRGVGDDTELRSLIKQEGIEKRVFISVDNRDNTKTSDLYNMFDVFVLPSLYEGLPVVAIEAQANGLKVIASDTVTDEIALSEKVKRIPLDVDFWVKEMLDEDNYTRIGKEEFDFSKSNYDIQTQVKKREEEYCEMIVNG